MLEQLLTVDEVAAWLKVERRTILSRIKKRIYLKGVHYYCPRGSRPRFRVSALMAWLEERDVQTSNAIPMARGYDLGQPGLTQKGQRV
jgi:excisionase family DNA binding protein